MRSGSIRPAPAMSHTGVPKPRAISATDTVSATTSAFEGPAQSVVISTRSAEARGLEIVRLDPPQIRAVVQRSRVGPQLPHREHARGGRQAVQSAPERPSGGVGIQVVHHPHRLGAGIHGGEHPGRQPHQRGTVAAPVQQAPARREQALGIVSERRQRRGRLPDQRRHRHHPSPGHIPQPLNRMHEGDATHNPEAPAAAPTFIADQPGRAGGTTGQAGGWRRVR